MDRFFALCTLLLVVGGSALVLGLLRRGAGGARRREVQLAVLAAPAIGLALGLGSMHSTNGTIWDACLAIASGACSFGALRWHVPAGAALSVGLSLAMGLVALGAIALGLGRLVLVAWLAVRTPHAFDQRLQAHADRLARNLGLGGQVRPRVLVRVCDRPLAHTWGLRRPTVVLSTWMLDHLDAGEIEAVLAHELGHVARGDYRMVWLATVLRDAFFYLPTSRLAYRQLQQEKELDCDDLAVALTRRPLRLAGALAKVWHGTLDAPSPKHLDLAQTLVGARRLSGLPRAQGGEAALEGRIRRLLDMPTMPADTAVRPRRGDVIVRGASGGAVCAMLLVGTLFALAALAMIGCGVVV